MNISRAALLSVLGAPCILGGASAAAAAFVVPRSVPARLANKIGDTRAKEALALASTVARTSAADAISRANTSGAKKIAPLADVPMHRLKLPKSAAGREFVAIKLKVRDTERSFMLDTALTAELITPHLQRALSLDGEGGAVVEGLAAGGKTSGEKLVTLEGVSLCRDGEEDLPIPTLHAVVTDFPQEHIDPTQDPVEGMLGEEFLELFDVDFDFPAGRVRFWAPGTAAAVAAEAGMVEIPAAVINETLLFCIRVTSAKGAKGGSQPFIGVIDCGSSFSAVNWEGAKLLGLPSKKMTYFGAPTIIGVGIDGKPLPLPTREVELSFVGDAIKDGNGISQFTPPPEHWHPWDKVRLGIGDLPIFALALGEDDKTPFKGPAAVIGLDVLSQRRVILETCRGTLHCGDKRRRIFVSPE